MFSSCLAFFVSPLMCSVTYTVVMEMGDLQELCRKGCKQKQTKNAINRGNLKNFNVWT